MAPVWEFDYNSTAHDAGVELVQLGSLIANPFLNA
jgi:hypothetical protein